MRIINGGAVPARIERPFPLHGVRHGTESATPNYPRPAHTGFSSLVAEIVLGKWEIEYFRLYSEAPSAAKSSIAGKYQYRCGIYTDELHISGEIFRWNKGGWIVSAPVKSEDEWLEWINQL